MAIPTLVGNPSILDPDNFETEMDLLLSELNPWADAANALAAGMDSAAAGGAMTLRYTFSTTTTDADPGAGFLRLSSATQNASTVMRCDLLDATGATRTATLDTFDDSTSAVKGHFLLQGVADQSDFILFALTSTASPSGYRNFTVVVVDSSAASPFANGDSVVLKFARTGDASVGSGTSATSNAIPTSGMPVSKSFTVETGRDWGPSTTLKIASSVSTYNWMLGDVTSYNSGTGALVMNITNSNGSGTFASWVLSVSAPVMATTNNSVQSKSAGFTLSASDRGGIFSCTSTWTAAYTAAATLGNGWYAYFRNDGTGTITHDPNSAETIDGLATLDQLPGQIFLVFCDGANLLLYRIGAHGGGREARTANTALARGDRGKFIDITSGSFTQTFAAVSTLGADWWVEYRNSTAANITLDPNASETIDGVASGPIRPGWTLRIWSDGTNLQCARVGAASSMEVLTSGTAWVAPLGVRRINRMRMGGGGQGGAGGGTSDTFLGASGHSGAYLESSFPVIPGTSYTYAIGAGGTGSAATGGTSTGARNNGSDTTFTANGVTYTAAASTSDTTGAAATNGDLNIPGQVSWLFSNGPDILSMAGASPLGTPGKHLNDTQQMLSAGYTVGGCGGPINVAGQDGRQGVIILEY